MQPTVKIKHEETLEEAQAQIFEDLTDPSLQSFPKLNDPPRRDLQYERNKRQQQKIHAEEQATQQQQRQRQQQQQQQQTEGQRQQKERDLQKRRKKEPKAQRHQQQTAKQPKALPHNEEQEAIYRQRQQETQGLSMKYPDLNAILEQKINADRDSSILTG